MLADIHPQVVEFRIGSLQLGDEPKPDQINFYAKCRDAIRVAQSMFREVRYRVAGFRVKSLQLWVSHPNALGIPQLEGGRLNRHLGTPTLSWDSAT